MTFSINYWHFLLNNAMLSKKKRIWQVLCGKSQNIESRNSWERRVPRCWKFETKVLGSVHFWTLWPFRIWTFDTFVNCWKNWKLEILELQHFKVLKFGNFEHLKFWKFWSQEMFLFSSKGIPNTPQHTDSHPCTRLPSGFGVWGGRGGAFLLEFVREEAPRSSIELSCLIWD